MSLDTTLAVTEGVREIVKTLVEALVLVMIVVFLFLQSWRATLIPLLAVPVSLVGTFILFPVLGFSVNTLSLFGLVLAIGLVVDDAIVVVEAVERKIEDGLAPKEATIEAMREITGPVVAVALVLASVFVPTAFIPGITGKLFQQFAVTIAVSVLLSAMSALTLAPALCGMLLKPRKQGHGLLAKAFGWFNRAFEHSTDRYVRISGYFVRKIVVTLLLLGIFGAGAAYCGLHLPTSFLPDEDQGYFFVNLQLPNGASLQRTNEVCRKVEKLIASQNGVEHVTTVVGFSLISGVQTTYNGFFFVTLKPWADRTKIMQSYPVIKGKLNLALVPFPQGQVFGFSPPAIPGIGAAGGVTFALEDRSGGDVQHLADNLKIFLNAAKKRPELAQLMTTFDGDVPQVFIDVDRDKAMKQGVKLSDVYHTMAAFMGGAYINNFNYDGRQWPVYIQAEGSARTRADQVKAFYVLNQEGDPVPLSSLVKVEKRLGPEFTLRYNLYRSAQIIANPAPGYSSGEAMNALEETFHQTMPSDMGYSYIGMSFQEMRARNGISASTIFGFSLLFVFLILAALYESWSLPLAVLLCTPVAVCGTLAALYLRRAFENAVFPSILVSTDFDVFAQIGLVMIIGLVAKNAILIVEFAKAESDDGAVPDMAALKAARLRLRPILMTSFAFILGCVPLWVAKGSGAISRQIMGTAVIGGMLAASLIAIFLMPAGFVLVHKFAQAFRHERSGAAAPAAEGAS